MPLCSSVLPLSIATNKKIQGLGHPERRTGSRGLVVGITPDRMPELSFNVLTLFSFIHEVHTHGNINITVSNIPTGQQTESHDMGGRKDREILFEHGSKEIGCKAKGGISTWGNR